jgi:hypothetical protein
VSVGDLFEFVDITDVGEDIAPTSPIKPPHARL